MLSRRSSNYGGWSNTSQDYHDHITTIARMPSVLPDVPQYPTVHKAFNHKYNYGEEQGVPKTFDHKYNYGEEQGDQQQPKKSSSKTHKKVQMSDHVEVVESGATDDNCEVQERSIDSEAEGFIKQKRKVFELCKWKTFKL